MDSKRQPGIVFHNIILEELTFKREVTIDESAMNDVKMSVNLELSEDSKKLSIKVTCSINDENKNPGFYVKCVMVGFFSQSENDSNMSLKDFARLNGPALMIPYIREVISNITLRSGIKPFMLPPINMAAIK